MVAVSQVETLRWFTVLHTAAWRETSSFLLHAGLNESGQALSLAAVGVGIPLLSIDTDASRIQAARRSGACTFAVTTLDEALRILKNAVRQGSGVSVALQAPVDAALRELHARGVSPLATPDLESSLRAVLRDQWLIDVHETTFLRERAQADVDLASSFTQGNSVADASRDWLRVAAQLFPRDRTRNFWRFNNAD